MLSAILPCIFFLCASSECRFFLNLPRKKRPEPQCSREPWFLAIVIIIPSRYHHNTPTTDLPRRKSRCCQLWQQEKLTRRNRDKRCCSPNDLQNVVSSAKDQGHNEASSCNYDYQAQSRCSDLECLRVFGGGVEMPTRWCQRIRNSSEDDTPGIQISLRFPEFPLLRRSFRTNTSKCRKTSNEEPCNPAIGVRYQPLLLHWMSDSSKGYYKQLVRYQETATRSKQKYCIAV